jgi:hypothetical protein
MAILRCEGRLVVLFNGWLDRLKSIAEEGQRRGEVCSGVDPAQLATLIVSMIEGSVMISQLQRDDHPLKLACRHLEEHLETNVRAQKSKTRREQS